MGHGADGYIICGGTGCIHTRPLPPPLLREQSKSEVCAVMSRRPASTGPRCCCVFRQDISEEMYTSRRFKLHMYLQCGYLADRSGWFFGWGGRQSGPIREEWYALRISEWSIICWKVDSIFSNLDGRCHTRCSRHEHGALVCLYVVKNRPSRPPLHPRTHAGK